MPTRSPAARASCVTSRSMARMPPRARRSCVRRGRLAMRIHTLIVAAALLLASRTGLAQTPAPPASLPSVPGPTAPSFGTVDFGVRGTGTDQDTARYERYRDLRTGAASRFTFAKETASYAANANAFNV